MSTTEPEPEPGAAPHPEAVDYDEVATEDRGLPGPSALEVLVGEFLAAVPEVRDSLLAAADALLDAARALIDAADRVLRKSGDDEPTQ
ncbi:MAG TPA: hypothetical protein VEP49_18510 [Acidimicrobiia bacterium]|nr:hypothetical protein [Acidimicrobiia bacterium]